MHLQKKAVISNEVISNATYHKHEDYSYAEWLEFANSNLLKYFMLNITMHNAKATMNYFSLEET